MINKLKAQICEYFVGKEDIVKNVLICLIAGGHVLLEDVPGVGKTTLARVLSGSISSNFKRISFTPDTLPSDVTGLSIYNMKTGEFEYHEGSVIGNVILADEINRTSPRTQSALLEAMSEGQVTVDGQVYKLPDPFIVIATQNPSSYIGTYPLPEAQMDRFMMRLSIGYPDEDNEILMARNERNGKNRDNITPICTTSDIIRIKEDVRKVYISDAILSYIREIIALTRTEKRYTLGASPRATIALMNAAAAHAYIEGRDFVKPDDVKAVAGNVLCHRLILSTEARIGKENPDSILKSLIVSAKVPME